MTDFNQRIRQKLENHRLPVDEALWLAIEHRMTASGTPPPPKRAILPYYWLIGGGAAAAVAVVLLLLFTPFSEQPQTNRGTAQRLEQQSFALKSDAEKKTNSNARQTAPEHTNNLYSNPVTFNSDAAANTFAATKAAVLNATKSKSAMNGSGYVCENSILELSQEPHSTNTDTTNQSADNVKLYAQSNEKRLQQSSVHPQMTRLPDLNDYPEISPQPYRAKSNRKVSLAASFRTGGRITVDKDINALRGPLAMKKAPRALVSKEITDNYIGILNASDYSNAIHQPPISAGITIDVPLNNIFGIETGLVYTYLKSDFKKSGGTSLHYNGRLQLHYLGVPLNFRVKVLNKDSWNVYVSAGAMAEKGLLSLYDQEAHTASSQLYKRSTTVKSSIDGIQLSMNGAVGAEYKLSRHIGFFLEPKVIYYFENNQPMSARSEHPLNIGISCGIRFGL